MSVAIWRDIFESLNDAVIVLSGALEPVLLNPAAETMLGASQLTRPQATQIIARNPWLERMVTSCLATGQGVGDPETTLEVGRASLAVRADVSPLLGSDGGLKGVVILLHDLSQQKSAETAAGGEAYLGMSPAGLAHEVKNPLTGIKGAAELLEGMLPADERVREYCQVILRGVDRIAGLVEQVLSVGGPQRLQRAPVNIHRVLHQALAMAGLHPQSPPGINLEQAFDPSLPEVFGDEAALERAFLNLIKNAAEAIGVSGTMRLTTRMESQFRLASQGQRRQFLRVEIADSGRGLSARQMRQLFAPFFTTKPAGTGLGLVLSRRIIMLHGGKLWAERGGIDARAGEESTLDRVLGSTAAADDAAPAPGEERGGEPGRGEPRGMTFKVILPVGGDEGAGNVSS